MSDSLPAVESAAELAEKVRRCLIAAPRIGMPDPWVALDALVSRVRQGDEALVQAERDALAESERLYGEKVAAGERLSEMLIEQGRDHNALNEQARELAALRERLSEAEKAMRAAVDELGVPGPDYPAPVANAHAILCAALRSTPESEEA